MKTSKMLEFLRKINCLGYGDIANMFNDTHMNDKYEESRDYVAGGLGNFHFIFKLDNSNFEIFYKYVLAKFNKDTNTETFMKEVDEVQCPFCTSQVLLIQDTYCCDECGGSFEVVQEPQEILLTDAKK